MTDAGLKKHFTSCHAAIDPPGYALENFDVMGGWRKHYRSQGEGKTVDLEIALRQVAVRISRTERYVW